MLSYRCIACIFFLSVTRSQSLSNGKAEVIGAAGRIGSQFLRLEEESQAIPRGVCPGSCSAAGFPIYIATPSNCWNELYQLTPPHRRSDLVFVGNGLPPKIDDLNDLTLVVPHYGISRPGEKPIPQCDENRMLPTYCYGRHAPRVQKLLQRDSISVEIVDQYSDIRKIAKRKLLWATCMWLLCHDNTTPISVSQVHERRALDLQQLVQELWMHALSDDADAGAELTTTLAYLKKYSFSIAKAIPSKSLALEEVEDRNGYFWRRNLQPLHDQLLKRVGGDQILDRVQNSFTEGPAEPHSFLHTIPIPHLNMTVYGTRQSGTQSPHTVLIIGSGIMGRSIALNLQRRGIRKIIMVDPSLPEITQTTKGSWAWINANQKQPDHYRCINQLGMMAWRRDSALSDLVEWKGSVVKVSSPLDPQFLHGYGAEGPLSIDVLQQLEPSGNFSSPGCYYYHFRDEGSVDPSVACIALQKAMHQSEISYVSETVVEYWRDTEGKVIGVVMENGTKVSADVVVVAAGTGSSTLAKIPMQHSPGRIAFASSAGKALRKIIVDTVAESHVLQRRDGTIVAGGGYLQVGGSSGRPDPKCCRTTYAWDSSEHQSVEEANRPIPQDGLPVTGWVEPGLYVAVTHSGITLAPFLSALVAIEITDGAELAILKPYRALRFQLKESTK